MKRVYINILMLLTISICVSSCNNFINKGPISSLSNSNFYKNKNDISLGVTGAYSTLQSIGLYGRNMAVLPDMHSDNCVNRFQGNPTWGNIIQFQVLTQNTAIKQIWDASYHSILSANIVLEQINSTKIRQKQKELFSGQLKFIRALNYFNLVRLFGGVPLVLHSIESTQKALNIGRGSVKEVYKQIIKDLQDAENSLPITYSNSETGRVTRGAAEALLGKVYLTIKEYKEAKNEFKKVIDSGKYKLLKNYANLWNLSMENNSEIIFAIQFKKGGTGTGSAYANLFAPKNSGHNVVQRGPALGFDSPSQDIINAYEKGGVRKDLSIALAFTNQKDDFVPIPYTVKYEDAPFIARDSDNNWILLRYAGILLMYAEVLNEINHGPMAEAYKMINKVRLRAGLNKLNGLDYESFFKAVQHERRVELAFEGHRWFDLIRTGRAVKVMNKFGFQIEKYQTLLPIPQAEINKNPNLKQNPGY